MRFMAVPMDMRSPEGARKALDMLIQSYESPAPIFALAIADAQPGDCVGFCQLWPHDDPGTMELVYAITPGRHGLGMATEAAGAVTHYALSAGHLEHVVAFVITEHRAPVRVVERLGFQKEGSVTHHGRASIRLRASRGWRMPALSDATKT